MEYEKTIKEAEELAKILIKKKARKSFGIYYFTWGFYYLYVILISEILSYLNVTNVIIGSLPYFAFVIPLYYTYRMVRDINWEFIVQRHRIENLEKAKKQYTKELAISYVIITIIFTLIFYVIVPLSTSEIVRLVAVSLFVIFILYWLYKALYSANRFVDPKYYDHLAVISFPFLTPVMAGLLPSIMTFSISMLVAMAWLYAGFISILEVSEIE